MRLKTIYSAIILVAAVILAACHGADTVMHPNPGNANTAPAGPETTHADGARRITTGELETLMKEGKAYVVDVRSQDSYDMGHIPGSRLIPAGLISQRINDLPRDKMIVTYCS